jgi:hypothetical protein
VILSMSFWVHAVLEIVFWDMAPCSLVDRYQGFEGTCCIHFRVDESGSSRATWHHIPDESSLHCHSQDKIRSHVVLALETHLLMHHLLEHPSLWLSCPSCMASCSSTSHFSRSYVHFLQLLLFEIKKY